MMVSSLKIDRDTLRKSFEELLNLLEELRNEIEFFQELQDEALELLKKLESVIASRAGLRNTTIPGVFTELVFYSDGSCAINLKEDGWVYRFEEQLRNGLDLIGLFDVGSLTPFVNLYYALLDLPHYVENIKALRGSLKELKREIRNVLSRFWRRECEDPRHTKVRRCH